ncbi:MAG: hypothetical protein ACPHRO_06730, partial [Nannocystaceae bacterium]
FAGHFSQTGEEYDDARLTTNVLHRTNGCQCSAWQGEYLGAAISANSAARSSSMPSSDQQ